MIFFIFDCNIQWLLLFRILSIDIVLGSLLVSLAALDVVLEFGVTVEVLELLRKVRKLLGFVLVGVWQRDQGLTRAGLEKMLLLLNFLQFKLLLVSYVLKNILDPDALDRWFYLPFHIYFIFRIL